jgi:predicted nucleotidyltransferase
MNALKLTDEIINKVKTEAAQEVQKVLGDNLESCVLYGSCARGDYADDSDIDIALLVRCDRMEAKKYSDALADIATQIAMKYFAMVNFVCIPYEEYMSKKSWYLYFKNINEEGVVIYG